MLKLFTLVVVLVSGVMSHRAGILPLCVGAPTDISVQIMWSAREYGIPMHIACGMVRTESRFQRRAKGAHGEIGLLQILPSTGRLVCHRRRAELWDPATNLNCGFRFYARLRTTYGSDWLALVGFNQGPRVASRLQAQGRGYPERVMEVQR